MRLTDEYIEEQRQQYPDLVVLNLGNNLGPDSDKNETILKSLKLLSPSLDMEESNSKIKVFADRNIVVIGQEGGNDLVDLKRTMEPYSKFSDRIFLSKNHTDAFLKKVLISGLFTQIISSNTTPRDHEPDGRERKNPDLLLKLDDAVQIVPLGAQGVLQNFPVVEMKISKIMMNNTEKPLFGGVEPTFSWEKSFHVKWLTPEYEKSSILDQVLSHQSKIAKEKFINQEATRLKEFKSTSYVGAKACQQCHSKEYDVWKNSKHSHAIQTLIRVDKHQDNQCIGCHVVGWSNKGYVSEEKTPHLSGVQCENCHGARKQHLTDLQPVKNNPRNVCQECHKGQHSPEFDFKDYWLKIEHGKSATL